MSEVDKQRVIEALASLRAMSSQERARAVDEDDHDYVFLARAAGKDGTPLLRFLIEDERTRPFAIDAGLRVWLEIDAQEALLVAVEHIDAIDRATFVAALGKMDGAEAVDFLHTRLVRDPDVLPFVAHAFKLVRDDDRFTEIALSRVHDDVAAAAALLVNVATPRALEELSAIFARHRDDDTVRRAIAAAAYLRPYMNDAILRADPDWAMRISERAEIEQYEAAQAFEAAERAVAAGDIDEARRLLDFAVDREPENDRYRSLWRQIALQRFNP